MSRLFETQSQDNMRHHGGHFQETVDAHWGSDGVCKIHHQYIEAFGESLYIATTLSQKSQTLRLERLVKLRLQPSHFARCKQRKYDCVCAQ